MAAQAEALGHDVTDISAFETGNRAPPPEYIQQLCSWLGVPGEQRAEFEKRVPRSASVIEFPRKRETSSSVRMFRKVSKMTPAQIRALGFARKKGAPDD